MQIILVPFGLLREKFGSSRCTVDVDGQTVRLSLQQVFDERALHMPAGSWESWLRVAVDDQYILLDAEIIDGMELALIPPVSGGMESPSVTVDLVEGRLEDELPLQRSSGGSLVQFDGVVRADPVLGGVREIFYEAHTTMALKEMNRLAQQALANEGVLGVAIRHRIGTVPVGESAIRVWIESVHRGEGFSALKTLMDKFKQVVPIFKKEIGADGDSRWVGLAEQPERLKVSEE